MNSLDTTFIITNIPLKLSKFFHKWMIQSVGPWETSYQSCGWSDYNVTKKHISVHTEYTYYCQYTSKHFKRGIHLTIPLFSVFKLDLKPQQNNSDTDFGVALMTRIFETSKIIKTQWSMVQGPNSIFRLFLYNPWLRMYFTKKTYNLEYMGVHKALNIYNLAPRHKSLSPALHHRLVAAYRPPTNSFFKMSWLYYLCLRN